MPLFGSEVADNNPHNTPIDVKHSGPSIARVIEVFRQFLLLGCSSFGGPVAHLGYFRERFVQREKWLTDAAYADLVALCQFLPGPASSQVGIGIGLMRAGLRAVHVRMGGG